MANIENLKVPTSEQAREYGRKGGIASGKARQEKATFKKQLQMILDEKYNEQMTYREAITTGQIISAIEGKAENFKLIFNPG